MSAVFPFDCQLLPVSLRAKTDPASVFRWVPSSLIGGRLKHSIDNERTSATIAGWKILGTDNFADLSNERDLYEKLAHFGHGFVNNRSLTGWPYYNDMSEAKFLIQVQREPNSYVYNFAILVALLIVVAFSTFLFPSSAMDTRIDVTLAVFLGVIFFQILIVETLPRTGYFTSMHLFMFLSSIFNVVSRRARTP